MKFSKIRHMERFMKLNSRDLADKILNFIKKPKKFLYKAKLAHKSLHNYEFHKLEEKFLKEILF